MLRVRVVCSPLHLAGVKAQEPRKYCTVQVPKRRRGPSSLGLAEARLLLGSPMALRKANVLVVDDKRANLLGLEAVLGDLYNVIFAISGEESLDILRHRSDVDLILMDVQMPGMDGFETAQHIKQM